MQFQNTEKSLQLKGCRDFSFIKVIPRTEGSFPDTIKRIVAFMKFKILFEDKKTSQIHNDWFILTIISFLRPQPTFRNPLSLTYRFC